jgi:hypothetical protein
MSRPTEDELEDAAETGRAGCLLPEIEDDEGGEDEGDDE